MQTPTQSLHERGLKRVQIIVPETQVEALKGLGFHIRDCFETHMTDESILEQHFEKITDSYRKLKQNKEAS